MPLRSALFMGDAKLEAAASADNAHIAQGATGEHVKKIQTALNVLDRADLTVDGAYGPRTAHAVRNYKTARNIVNKAYQSQADDIVGRMTVAALDAELVEQKNTTVPAVEIGRRYGAPPAGPHGASPTAPAGQSGAPASSPGLTAMVRGNPHRATNIVPIVALPPSVPPLGSSVVSITVTPALSGTDVIELSIAHCGWNNGIALINPTSIQSSQQVTVTGAIQTEPGRAGALQIEARMNGALLAVSNGFSVCAHPVSLTTRFYQSIDDDAQLGMIVIEELPSDTGDNFYLNQVDWEEVVEEITRDIPPFQHGTPRPSDWLPCVPPPGFNAISDRHAEPRPDAGPAGKTLKVQAHMFTCKRCGATEIPVPDSGFEIEHVVKKIGADWMHQVFKRPLDRAGGRSRDTRKLIISTAGRGGAESPPRRAGPKAP